MGELRIKLANKVALVTGASSGIGKEIAFLFAKEGATIVLTARNLDRLKEVEQAITKAGGKAYSISMDVIDRDSIKKAFSEIISKYETIDILVNSAGIAIWNSIQDVSDKEFDDHIEINIVGYYNCIKAVLPTMLGNKSGCIINLISGSGKRARSGTVAYAASKFGAAGLSDAVFEDVKDKGINVTAIYPGKTNTPIHALPADDPKRAKMLDPVKVAELALHVTCLPSNTKIKEVEIRPLD